MKIYSWNVNGLRSILNKGFKEWAASEGMDILCLQETKVQTSQIDTDVFKGMNYNSYFNSALRKGYSGTATFTRTLPLSVKYGFGIDRFDSEGRVIEAEYGDFTLFNIYFPNGQMSEERLNFKLEFYDAALKYFDTYKDAGKNLVICGDFNTAHNEIDIKNARSNEKYSGFLPVEREWMDKFISHGYIDTFRFLHPDDVKYSWWSYRFNARERNAGWRIDYFFVSENISERVKKAEILNTVSGSDHCPIMIDLE